MLETKETILIVDDESINIDILSNILIKKYNILVAGNGKSAIELTQKLIPDLVLLDIILPDINGFDVCKFLNHDEKTRSIPIIFLSSLTDIKNEVEGLECGARDFIHKPYNVSIIMEKVRIHLESKAQRDKLNNLVQKRTSDLEKTKDALIASLAIATESRDSTTGEHIYRTAQYMIILANNLKDTFPEFLTPNIISLLSSSAQLHDVGKIHIPDKILLKTDRLSISEMQEMEMHTIYGSEILRKTEAILGESSFLSFAIEIAQFHHEKWDGSGYPFGLRENQIPLSAQMMSIIDVHDALVSIRPYKRAFSHEQAMLIILEGDIKTKPSHFSALIKEAFIKCENEFKYITISTKNENQRL